MITLHDLADIGAVHRLVGDFPSDRWGRGSVEMRRSDGRSVIDWFERFGAGERVRQVRRSILDRHLWQALLRFETLKADGKTRPIDVPTVLDMARIYRLYATLHPEIDRGLTRACIGYRFQRSLLASVQEIQQAMRRFPFAVAVDVARYFETISWRRLDKLIASLPCDSGVARMLQDLVRVPVVLRDGSSVQRWSGLPQGLSTSPLLANLFLAEFDRLVTHLLAKLPGRLFRYSDNILVLLGHRHHGGHAFDVVRDRIEREGLRLKESEPLVVDVRETGLDWLGLRIWPDRVEVTKETVARKAEQYRADLVTGLKTVQSTEHRIEALARYYAKLTSPERGEQIRLKITEELGDQLLASGKEHQNQDTEKTRIVIPMGLGREDRHIPSTELERNHERGREETQDTPWHPTPTPGSPRGKQSPSSSAAAIRPLVSKSDGLLAGAPASPAPGKQHVPVVSVRLASRCLAWIMVRRGEDHEKWPLRLTAASKPELELRALAAGVRAFGVAGYEVVWVAPGRHAGPYLLGHLRPRGVRMTLAYRELMRSSVAVKIARAVPPPALRER